MPVDVRDSGVAMIVDDSGKVHIGAMIERQDIGSGKDVSLYLVPNLENDTNELILSGSDNVVWLLSNEYM